MDENEILKFWDNIQCISTQEFLSSCPSYKKFNFINGPPFATGNPHYGHIVTMCMKDTIIRYKTMTGFNVKKRFGWDCHGLPIELLVEKELKIKSQKEIEEFGIENYNNKCRELIMKCRDTWNDVVKRCGFSFDMENDYKTMDLTYMSNVWKVFHQLYNMGLIYEGYKVLPYSSVLGTPISNFEASQNYKNVSDPSIIVKFKMEYNLFNIDSSDNISSDIDDNSSTLNTINILVWTTTPFTLPCNMALCVNENFDYCIVECGLDKDDNRSQNEKYLICKDKINLLSYTYNQNNIKILKEMKGKDLVGIKYIPIMNYKIHQNKSNIFRIVSDDYVTSEKGTGIVHIAPQFGEDDYRVCIKNNLISKNEKLFLPLDVNCNFTQEISEFEGRNCKSCDKDIIKLLKSENKLYSSKFENHEYPFCWRSDTPLIYRICNSWFINVEAIKSIMIENNKSINWIPSHIKEGRYGKWLEGIRDWCISRNRFWGNPIPIWKAMNDDNSNLSEYINNNNDIYIIKSPEELSKLSGIPIDDIIDLHRDKIDNITFELNGKTYKRIPDVMDCWFESGCVPFGVNMNDDNGNEISNKDNIDKSYNNDFQLDYICEGIDQTRGWFYTLNVISSAIRKQPAFKNVNVCGLVLASDGTKMSKNKKNYSDVMDVINKSSADTLRLYLNGSNASKGNELKFNDTDVYKLNKNTSIYIKNTLEFLRQCYDFSKSKGIDINLYIIDNFNSNIINNLHQHRYIFDNFSDRWIFEELKLLYKNIHFDMEKYDLNRTTSYFVKFIETFSKWYININKKRFKNHDQNAMNTLFNVLYYFSIIYAPFSPFMSESIYQNLSTYVENKDRLKFKNKSVHFIQIPFYLFDVDININSIENNINDDKISIQDNSIKKMEVFRSYVELSRELRGKLKMTGKKPFKKTTFISIGYNLSDHEEILSDMVNFVLCEFVDIRDISHKLTFRVKKKFNTNKNYNNDFKIIDVDYYVKNHENEDLIFQIGFKSDYNQNEILLYDEHSMIIMDTGFDEECENIFEAKKLNRHIMNMRKNMGLVPKDKIRILYRITEETSKLKNMIVHQEKYLFPLLNIILEHDVESNIDKNENKIIEIFDGKIEILILRIR